MSTIHIRKTIDSETLILPELKPLIGCTVEITISAHADPAVRAEFYDLLGQVPPSEAAWAERQATLRTWRTDQRFEPYWPVIDHMLTVDFASFRRRAAAGAGEAAGNSEGYDDGAWREQREYDLQHAHDHLT